MLLSEMIYMVRDEYGSRNQLSDEQVLTLLDTMQRMAFDYDLSAFLYWDRYLVVDTLAPAGPYDYPDGTDADPDCRKMMGVTAYSDTELLAAITGSGAVVTDYGLPISSADARKLFIPARLDPIMKRFILLDASNLDTTPDTYRVVYFRRPPRLIGPDQDADVWIPDEFHHTLLVQGATVLARNHLYGDFVPKETLLPYLQPFWDSMVGAMDQGNRTGMFSAGQPGL